MSTASGPPSDGLDLPSDDHREEETKKILQNSDREVHSNGESSLSETEKKKLALEKKIDIGKRTEENRALREQVFAYFRNYFGIRLDGCFSFSSCY